VLLDSPREKAADVRRCDKIKFTKGNCVDKNDLTWITLINIMSLKVATPAAMQGRKATDLTEMAGLPD
jgi:hypothetical protein